MQIYLTSTLIIGYIKRAQHFYNYFPDDYINIIFPFNDKAFKFFSISSSILLRADL
jgi:hypothetical protein